MKYDLMIMGDLQLTSRTPKCRLDDFAEAQFLKFMDALRLAEANGVKAVLQPGDWWDAAAPGYGTYARYAALLADCVGVFRVFACYGQHDLFYHSLRNVDNTSLKALETEGLLEILTERPTVIDSHSKLKLRLYGASWGQPIPEVRKQKGFLNVLVTHKTIAPKGSDRGEFKPTDADTFAKQVEAQGYHLAVMGDYHFPFQSGNKKITLINAGVMSRMKADEASIVPRVCFWSASNPTHIEWVELEHKPAAEVITREHLDSKRERKQLSTDFFDKLKEEKDFSGRKFTHLITGILDKVADHGTDDISPEGAAIIHEAINRISKQKEGKPK